jgi:hypothetical protein
MNPAPPRLGGSRSLPRNISAHPDGYVVRVKRSGVFYQAFVAKGFKAQGSTFHVDGGPTLNLEHGTLNAALAEAVRLRDRFIAIHGAIAPKGSHKKAYSNTGVVGVSEATAWHHSKPYDCFIASWRETGRGRTKRFYYGEHRARAEAFHAAVQWRAQHTSRKAAKAAKGGN